mgnify:CR=1 FL=1
MTKPEIILCDLDGTIAEITHRLHFISEEITVGSWVKPKNVPYARLMKQQVIGSTYDPMNYDNVWITDKGNKYQTHELHKLKFYKSFFEAAKDDSPIQTTIEIVKCLSEKWPVVFCSGRPDNYRQITVNWIASYLPWVNGLLGAPRPQDYLIMRPAGDTRPDYVVKEELYHKYIEPNYTVKAVFDDRKVVVDMWRGLGLQCYAVCEGNY